MQVTRDRKVQNEGNVKEIMKHVQHYISMFEFSKYVFFLQLYFELSLEETFA